MYPVTFSANKHFIPVANKPLIFYPLETVAKAGIKDVAIVYNPGWLDAVKNLLGNGSKWGLKLTYVLQKDPIGLSNIFQVCEDFLKGDSFVLHLGDNIFIDGVKDQVEYFQKNKLNAMITFVKTEKGTNKRMGVPYLDKNGNLKKYVEKPKNPPNNFGIPGLYFFDNNVFKCFKGGDKITPSARGELEIGASYNWLVTHKYKVGAVEYKGRWLDPGKFDDWLETNRYLLDIGITKNGWPRRDEKKNITIEGRVEIGKNCKIKNCKIRGPVSIGNDVQIDGAYIGPYCSIYDNCKLSNCRISDTILMENVTISNVNRLIDSSIIGGGSIITDNDKTGEQIELFIGAQSEIIL